MIVFFMSRGRGFVIFFAFIFYVELGDFSHMFLDGMMHTDAQPFFNL